MKTAFVIADVHSFYDELVSALHEEGFDIHNPDHAIISLGDLLDRGEKPIECLNFINSLPKERKILIRGNHEDLLEEAIARDEFLSHDFHNGTVNTAIKLSGLDLSYNDYEIIDKVKKNDSLYEYLNSCVDYFEIDNNIFVHGWIPCQTYMKAFARKYEYNPNWRDANTEDWNDARWFNGFLLWDNHIVEPNETIWCGHWHTSWAHCRLHNDGFEWDEIGDGKVRAKFTPFEDKGIVGMDACTAYSGFVNCKKIELEM